MTRSASIPGAMNYVMALTIGSKADARSVVVATEGKPSVFTGSAPATMSISAVDRLWPCLSARSVTSIGDGVVYATRDGLAYIGEQGAQLYTQALFSDREWSAYGPGTMFCAWYADRIYIAYLTDTGLVIGESKGA